MYLDVDLTGERFGLLTVTGPTGKKRGRWQCLCECGGQAAVTGADLRSGHKKSCGCLAGTTLKKLREKQAADRDQNAAQRLAAQERAAKTTAFLRSGYGEDFAQVMRQYNFDEPFIIRAAVQKANRDLTAGEIAGALAVIAAGGQPLNEEGVTIP